MEFFTYTFKNKNSTSELKIINFYSPSFLANLQGCVKYVSCCSLEYFTVTL